jgi:hypothetical protein
MKRVTKASIAALALVPALGAAMAMPAGADNEVQINIGLNNCQVSVDANNNLPVDNGNLGRCYTYAVPDPDSHLYAHEISGAGLVTSRLYCNDPLELGAPTAIVTDAAGGSWSSVAFNNNAGGVCHLKVSVCQGSTKGSGWVSWVVTGALAAGQLTHCP